VHEGAWLGSQGCRLNSYFGLALMLLNRDLLIAVADEDCRRAC